MIGGLVALVFFIVKKISLLKSIDTGIIQGEREKDVKNRILKERLARIQSKKLSGVGKVARKAGGEVSRQGRRAVQRLYKLEQYYQKLKKQTNPETDQLSKDVIKRLMEEAEELIRQDEFIPAEKKYIEIISHNPKAVEAYEGLGNMYLKNKQYEQARETLKFTSRLDEEDASVQMSLAELEMAADQIEVALPYARRAVELRERNPKYLDIYTTISFKAKEKKDMRKGIDLLKDVNPENQKIEEFERQYQELVESEVEVAKEKK